MTLKIPRLIKRRDFMNSLAAHYKWVADGVPEKEDRVVFVPYIYSRKDSDQIQPTLVMQVIDLNDYRGFSTVELKPSEIARMPMQELTDLIRTAMCLIILTGRSSKKQLTPPPVIGLLEKPYNYYSLHH